MKLKTLALKPKREPHIFEPDRTAVKSRPSKLRPIGTAIALFGLLSGCAAMPTASPVMLGGTAVVADPAVGFIAAGPERGQGPEAIVRGFMLAAQSGSTMPTMFAAARQFLTPLASHTWRPSTQVWIMDETAALEVLDSEDPNRVTVRATGGVVAEVNAEGIYHEFPFPISHTTEFDLVYDGEDWRIAELEDGIIMPAQVFTAAFRYTKLYHPSLDYRTWVPDVRWFPQQTWQASAVQALLAGPPSFLTDVVQRAVPDNAAVALEEITEGDHGAIEVRLRGWLRDVTGLNRALFQAQLEKLLTDGSGTQPVGLADVQGSIPVPSYDLPAMPVTSGPALAIADNALYRIQGRDMIPVEPSLDLSGINITALATAPGGADGVVVRDGRNALWWVVPTSDDVLDEGEILLDAANNEYGDGIADIGAVASDGESGLEEELPDIPPGRISIISGENLIAPSIDNEGMVWSGEAAGPIQAVDYSGHVYEVTANWLAPAQIEHLTVAPGGRLVAVVTRDDDGTSIKVAGVIRNSQGVPIGLAEPIEVGASVHEVTSAAWQDDSVLAVIGWKDGVHGVYQVGVGGLDAPGGLPRLIPGIAEPHLLTASVGTGNMLAIDNESALHLREATSLWPIVGREVSFVAYPG